MQSIVGVPVVKDDIPILEGGNPLESKKRLYGL
jgi:hypothetical protein